MKNDTKYLAVAMTTAFHRRDSWVIWTSTGENISSFFNAVVDNEQQIIRFELKENYLNSINVASIILNESGPDVFAGAEKLQHDERVTLLESQGEKFFAVVKKVSRCCKRMACNIAGKSWRNDRNEWNRNKILWSSSSNDWGYW